MLVNFLSTSRDSRNRTTATDGRDAGESAEGSAAGAMAPLSQLESETAMAIPARPVQNRGEKDVLTRCKHV